MADKIKKIFYIIFDILDDILAYILTITGIIMSPYIPLLNGIDDFEININPWRLGLAAIIAFAFITEQESLDKDKHGNIIKSKEGRRKRFKQRMINALANGIMWSQFMNINKGV
jgi:hypothetical protein